jgi:hypothetical protein
MNWHETAGLGITLLQSSDPLKDLVSFLELPGVDQSAELLEIGRQAAALAAADCPFLPAAWPAPCQQVMDRLPFEQLDLHLRVFREHFPAALSQISLELG